MVVVTAVVVEEEEVAEPLQTSLKRRKGIPKEKAKRQLKVLRRKGQRDDK